MATEVASGYLVLYPRIDGLSKSISSALGDSSITQATQKSSKGIASTIGGAFKTVGKIGIGAIAGVGAAIGGIAAQGGISRALKIEQAQFKFKQLGMDVQKTMASCNEAVKGTAYGLDAAASAASMLGASGVASGEEMTRSLKAIAGTAAMTGSSYEDIGIIFSKIAAKGKVQGDELLQLSERGINATAILAKALGKTQAEVKDMVHDGEIDFKTFSDAMYASLGQAAFGANEMFTGAMSNVRAALSRIGAKFATPGLEALRKVFVALIPAIDGVSKALDPAVDGFTNFVNAASDKAVSVIGKFNSELEETGSVAGVFSKHIENAKNKIKEFVSNFSFADVIDKAFASAQASVSDFFDGLSSKVDHQSFADGLFQGIERHVSSIISKLDLVGGAFVGLSIAGTLSLNNLGGMLAKHGGILASLGGAYDKFFAKCSGAFGALMTKWKGFSFNPGSLMASIQNIPTSIKNVLVGGVDDAVTLATAKFSQGMSKIGSVLGNGKYLGKVAILEKFGAGVTNALSKVIAPFEGMFAKLTPLMTKFSGLSSRIATAFGLSSSAALGFVGALSKILNPVGMVISSFITMLATDAGYRASVGQTISAIGSGLLPAFVSIATCIGNLAMVILPVLNDVFADLTPVFAQIALVILQIVAAIAPLISTLVSALMPVITEIVTAVSGFITAVMPIVISGLNMIISIIQFLIPIITQILTVVVTVISGVISFIGMVVTAVINVATVVSSVVSSIVSFVTMLFTSVVGIATEIANFIGAILATICEVIQNAINIVMGIFSAIANFIGQTVSSIFTTVSTIFNNIASAILSACNNARSFALSIFNNILSGIGSVCSGILGVVQGGFNSAINFIKGLAGEAISWGANIVQGILDGLNSGLGAIGEWAANACSSIKDKILGFFGIHSPSRLMIELFGFVAEGAAIGLSRKSSSIYSEVDAINNGVESRAMQAQMGFGSNVDYGLSGDLSSGQGNVNNIGDIYIEARDLEDMDTIDKFVDMLKRSKRVSGGAY